MQKQTAIGAYTEIVNVQAPGSAKDGEPVEIVASVKNLLTDSSIYVAVTGRCNSEEMFFFPEYTLVGAGEVATFNYSLNMPSRDISLSIRSWYWTEQGWAGDDSTTTDITLIEPPPEEVKPGLPWLPIALGVGTLAVLGMVLARRG